MKKRLSLLLGLLLIGNLVFSSASALEVRMIDGSGNNISNPTWGVTGTQLLRIAPAGYDDNMSTPRGGEPSTLPNPREISNIVDAQSFPIPDPKGTSDMLWQWGQFVDHDIDLTPSAGESFNIVMPPDEPIFLPGQEMHMARSVYDISTGTDTSNPRQQINQITSFIDGSTVYGSDTTRNNFIRDLAAHNGKLKLDSNGLLPLNTDGLPNANEGPTPSNMLFLAGDVRANEQVGLTAMHTLLVREHNWLVDQLAATGVTGEEELYQQAKAIVEGEIQHITYNEFLPMLLGSYMPAPWTAYNPTVHPQIANEFSTAGYRVGHTMLSSELERFNEDGTVFPQGHLFLRDSFFNPQIIKDDGIEPVLRGLAMGNSEKIDNYLVDDVRNFLFGPTPESGGFDLAALNIQRGRDNGLPSYNEVRNAYGLSSVNDFIDITQDGPLADKLALVYDSVDDVDIWIGGISEPPVSGGMVGETFATILKEQFERVRDGDRFWYQNRSDLSPFQQNMIQETSLSDIIMRNSNVDAMQNNAFLAVDRRTADWGGNGGFHAVGGTPIPIDMVSLLIGTVSLEYYLLTLFVVLAIGVFMILYYTVHKNTINRMRANSEKFSY